MEEIGDAAAVLDTQTDEGEDADISIQGAGIGQGDTALGAQQRVEIINKIGEQVQEGAIKHVIQFRQVLVSQFAVSCELIQGVQITALDHLMDTLTHLVETVDIE